MRQILSLALAASLLTVASVQAKPKPAPTPPARPDPVATATGLRDRALSDATGMSVLESLTSEIGPRPAGSPAAERARDWGIAKLKALGFTNVHAEPFAKPSWQRGEESAEITAPYPFKLSVLGLGGTIATPAGGLEGDAVVFHTIAELRAVADGSLTGKIVVLNMPMVRTQDGSGYGVAVQSRYLGSTVARKGAVAYLLRSVSTSQSRQPHAGAMRYDAGGPQIPVAALGVPDANLIDRLSTRGPVHIRLKLANTTHADTMAWNVVGDIVGSEKSDEVIVIGGHLDSWDPGTGAIDDGAGVAITTAAATLIGQLPRHPRRTIRVVMWGSEETGGAGEAFYAAHKDELGKIIVAGESDLGSDDIYSLQVPKGSYSNPVMMQAASVLAPLKIMTISEAAKNAGSDVEEIQGAGAPVFSLNQDASRYFDLHHSADDTFEAVDPVKFNRNVAAWAALVYLIADSDIDFRALGAK
ncbi:MAG: peptidase family protein [Caulobacter sp.]|nr:peptidase family protein [Caulobacter sp.]